MFNLMKAINPICNRISCYPIANFSFCLANYSTPALSLGKPKKSKQTGPSLVKKVLPVEQDTHKLVKYVCGSNIFKEGEDIELKPDSDYPDWLWTLHIDKPETLDDLDPDSIKYWRKIRKAGIRRQNKLRSLRKL